MSEPGLPGFPLLWNFDRRDQVYGLASVRRSQHLLAALTEPELEARENDDGIVGNAACLGSREPIRWARDGSGSQPVEDPHGLTSQHWILRLDAPRRA